MATRIANAFPYYPDGRGRPLTGGSVYIGVANQDPEANPISLFWDSALSVAAAQPINVIGGLLNNNGNPAKVYCAESNYSERVRDADGAEVSYDARVVDAANLYQPIDSDLTAIAALSTTAFGRSLLTMADGPALRALGGIVDPLPRAGGQMTGEITRQGGGAYPYMADAAYTVARIFVTANGAADPRTQVGDLWLEEEA